MSTLSGALSGAVSALFSQSQAVSTISTNLANSETTAYKEANVNFATLVSGSTSFSQSSGFNGSGVYASTTQSISTQGNIASTGSSTDLAIDGDGFFVVSDASSDGDVAYTRAGDFTVDEDGYLTNSNGYYLMGYPTDSDGDTTVTTGTASSLEAVDVSSITGNASATENVYLDMNLPADAAVGDSFSTDVEIYDSLGTFHTVTYDFEKTASNQWELTMSDPVLSSDNSTTTGTEGGASITLDFNTDGTFASSTPDPATLDVTGWTTGAADSSIEIDLGNITQNTDESGGTDISIDSVTHDGIEYGELDSISVDDEGYVNAVFDNGTNYPVYQVPLATFNNPNGLTQVSGNAYTASDISGDATINFSGDGGAGAISGSSLEQSTVDSADQLTNLITAQQAYSSAAEVITTVDEMFDSLISAKR